MSSAADVSVVIPAYNAATFLREALESIAPSGSAKFEVIVVDDGSTDATAAIAGAFDGVRLFRQANAGAGAARNAGVTASSAALLAFLDADDVWPPGRNDALLAALSEGVDASAGSVIEFGQNRTDSVPAAAVLPGSTLIRREWFDRVGPMDERLRVGEFIDWWSRAQDAGIRLGTIPDVVLRRRLHDSNSGLRAQDARVDYTRVLRAALQRRRGTE